VLAVAGAKILREAAVRRLKLRCALLAPVPGPCNDRFGHQPFHSHADVRTMGRCQSTGHNMHGRIAIPGMSRPLDPPPVARGDAEGGLYFAPCITRFVERC
jgi:hypothetical protein